jgi:UDP-4-amino-4,6-dideoxy-N-acetyl-beta-L-altrosamine transaminase
MDFLPYGLHSLDEEDIKAVVKALKGDWITTGPTIPEFEQTLCDYIGCKHAIVVNSGTSALDIAIATLKLPPGSEVITTPFTFVASANAILYNNCKPIFADIEKETRNINPQEIEKKISDKTKAILFVDFAGHPCEIKEIRELAEKHDLYLIEDAAHALGAEYRGQKIGASSHMTMLSFHPVKHITTGEGGAIVTNDDRFVEPLRQFRNHGLDRTTLDRFGPKAGWAYDVKRLGRNYRMTDFQAILGISQLKKLDSFLSKRERIAQIYNERFAALHQFEIPTVKPYVRHAWHIYTVLVKDLNRDEFYQKMREQNIGVNVQYIPIYHFSYYQDHFNNSAKAYPVTEDVFTRILVLPLFPKMEESDIQRVISTVETIIKDA